MFVDVTKESVENVILPYPCTNDEPFFWVDVWAHRYGDKLIPCPSNCDFCVSKELDKSLSAHLTFWLQAEEEDGGSRLLVVNGRTLYEILKAFVKEENTALEFTKIANKSVEYRTAMRKPKTVWTMDNLKSRIRDLGFKLNKEKEDAGNNTDGNN